MTALSKRALACVDLMKTGAYWRYALETQFRGGEKFTPRLRVKGQVVPGYGMKTFFEMKDADLFVQRDCPRSSTWPQEYVLKAQPQEAVTC